MQGHVDTTATLVKVTPTGNALTLVLRLNNSPDLLPLPSSLSPYLIPKGYVTLDGASLTLIDVSPPQGGPLSSTASQPESEGGATPIGGVKEQVEFSVMLIAHTQDVIGLSKKKPGQTVNVELDVSADGTLGSLGMVWNWSPPASGWTAYHTVRFDAMRRWSASTFSERWLGQREALERPQQTLLSHCKAPTRAARWTLVQLRSARLKMRAERHKMPS